METNASTKIKSPGGKTSIIDCDIHATIPLDGIKPYLPRIYREQVETWGRRLPGQNHMYLNGGTNGSMQEHQPPRNKEEDSYLNYIRAQHIDKFNLEYGIMTGSDYGVHTTPDTDYAAALCSASNDYVIEHYLSRDSRLKGSVHIPKQDPILAAKEIDRVGSHPDMVQVIVSNGAIKPYGNRMYEPIYEACVRNNLPFAIHVSMEGIGINNPPTGAGYVSYYAEYRAARTQIMMAHMASFIFEGVFVKYPDLKVIMVEAGMMWVAPFIWRLDQDWKALRHQTPWVKEPPSEYYRKHMKVTSQPIELPPQKEMFMPMMEAIYARENLMFASDYPHWDFDSPLLAFPKMDEEMKERIFYQNAAELYRLPARKQAAGGALA
ncbi:amidohydrolase family protein [Paenibacillus sp. GYB004]|uniref:amidohydrolase family protein n=1 Tax=Paenibacillus sp. GYB004 TaxID=2994393 RepID=UPI002F96394E